MLAFAIYQMLMVVQLSGMPLFKIERSFLGVFEPKLVQYFTFFSLFCLVCFKFVCQR